MLAAFVTLNSRNKIGQSELITSKATKTDEERNCRGASFCSNYGSVRACKGPLFVIFSPFVCPAAKSRGEWSLREIVLFVLFSSTFLSHVNIVAHTTATLSWHKHAILKHPLLPVSKSRSLHKSFLFFIFYIK